ncbi:hypothetical protein GCM10027026_04800 [Myroides odoratimimus subsp. xuanwuensis]
MFAALAAWTLVDRSTIPTELHGTVTAVEMRHEKHPGVDDVWLISVDDGGLRHVDSDVADLLEVGASVEKDAWDTTLTVNGDPHPLSLSEHARAMLAFAPVIVLVIAALTLLTHLRARALRQPRV